MTFESLSKMLHGLKIDCVTEGKFFIRKERHYEGFEGYKIKFTDRSILYFGFSLNQDLLWNSEYIETIEKIDIYKYSGNTIKDLFLHKQESTRFYPHKTLSLRVGTDQDAFWMSIHKKGSTCRHPVVIKYKDFIIDYTL